MEYKQMHNPCSDCDPSDSCKNCQFGAYKATGLTPEDLMRAFDEDAVLKIASQYLQTTPARLRALAEADRDGRIVVMDEPVNISYKSQLSDLSELLEDAAEKIDDRCRAWMCIYQRAENDLDKIKGDIGLTAYKECLTMVDSIGQKCAEAEASLAGKEQK